MEEEEKQNGWTKHWSCNTPYILTLSFEPYQLEQKTKDLHLSHSTHHKKEEIKEKN